MPRTARAAPGGLVYHVLNRGNARTRIFRKDADYAAFIELLLEGHKHARVELFAYCLMPNHWHLVIRPRGGHDLGRYIGWVCNTHVKRYRQHYHNAGLGHLYQGRYKSFPIQEDAHLLAVLRYVEANPLRAKLVGRAEDWAWSSLGGGDCERPAGLLSAWPVDRPADWAQRVNLTAAEGELSALRTGVQRGRPFGSATWMARTASALGLGQTLRPRGRPRKQEVA